MHLHLIRHPRPIIAPGLCYGRTDVAIDALEVAGIVASLVPTLPKPARIICSPLQRCANLADRLVHAGCYAPAERDPNLLEMDFGTWEMRPWNGIARCEIDAWARDTVHYRPGGGESVFAMAQRLLRFCASIRQAADDDVIVVCHAGTIRLLQTWRPGIDAASMAHEAASTAQTIAYAQPYPIKIS